MTFVSEPEWDYDFGDRPSFRGTTKDQDDATEAAARDAARDAAREAGFQEDDAKAPDVDKATEIGKARVDTHRFCRFFQKINRPDINPTGYILMNLCSRIR